MRIQYHEHKLFRSKYKCPLLWEKQLKSAAILVGKSIFIYAIFCVNYMIFQRFFIKLEANYIAYC